MPCMTEVMDNDIFIRFLAYKEITTTIIDILETEIARLKRENEILKKEIDKAEKERTLCYACSKEIGDLANYVP